MDFAREKGLDAVNSGTCDVAEEIRRRNGGRLADAAIEGTGVGSVFCSCVECVRAHGTVSMMGNPAGDMTVPVDIHSMLLRKEVTINGIWNSSRAPYPVNEWKFTVQMMDEGRLVVDDLITDRVTQEELPSVIDEVRGKKRFPVKTMCLCG